MYTNLSRINEPRLWSSGGNTSSNPQDLALIPAYNRRERMCQRRPINICMHYSWEMPSPPRAASAQAVLFFTFVKVSQHASIKTRLLYCDMWYIIFCTFVSWINSELWVSKKFIVYVNVEYCLLNASSWCRYYIHLKNMFLLNGLLFLKFY